MDSTRFSAIRLLVIGFLLCPLFLSFFSIREKPLEGAFFNEGDAQLSIKGWFSGEYQAQKEKFLAHHFALHHTLVRLQCQLDFSAFRKANARFVVVGKDNYLYETSYINSYLGKDYVGKRRISTQVQKLKAVQEKMRSAGKALLPVIAPGKGWFYPEYIPARYGEKNDSTNYEVFSDLAAEAGLYVLDFNAYIMKEKANSRYPLYPQFGVHWSNYAALKCFDSICRVADQFLQGGVARLVFPSPEFSKTLQAPDDDVLRGMNLMHSPATFPMAYCTPSVTPTQDRKPRLLVVADSFWWHIYSTGLPGAVFSDNRFWYYNEAMYPESSDETVFVTESNYFRHIREADVILILYSESNLYKYGNGFIDMLSAAYLHPDPAVERIQERKSAIRATPEWYGQIKAKAAERDISVDSMLTLDAIYSLR